MNTIDRLEELIDHPCVENEEDVQKTLNWFFGEVELKKSIREKSLKYYNSSLLFICTHQYSEDYIAYYIVSVNLKYEMKTKKIFKEVSLSDEFSSENEAIEYLNKYY